ncbi:hypothetical protein PCE31106_03917 [Pandoraea cepalis]|uniref:Bacterial shufflon protein N-terminal domain-containing protein n=1 Tax=Pandoraea cepalis TaxID=2508294 RepID=A0A5E4XKG3_9BURK|nr:hypothetical protein [Pandoraea cepalis]VVE36618.1 hypothetical protein PCE31106_03917 [Pandoraea cepalis]
MRRHQSGIFLVSAAIAVGVVGMLVTFWGVEQSRQMRMARAERIGESLNMVGNAVETFTVKHHSDIEKLLSGKERSFTVNGVTFKSADTGPNGTSEIADLSADDVIRALQLGGVATTPPRGVGDYALRVYRVCDAGDARSCRIDTLTYLTEPIKKTYSSEPDLNLAVVAAKKMGVYGGLSSMNEADKFNFIGQTSEVLPVANPLGPIPGIIVMRGGSQTKDLNNTVMRDGSRDMTGSLKFASTDTKGASVSRDIVGAENIEASGTLNVGSIVAGATAVKGTLDLGSEANRRPVHNNIVNAGNIEGKGQLKMASASVGALVAEADGATINGKLNLSNNDIEAAKSVSAGKVSAEKVESRELKSKSGVVELGDAVTEGEVCDVWGLGRDTHGRILSCQKNDGQSWRWGGVRISVFKAS